MGRFLLNLQSANQKALDMDSTSKSTRGTATSDSLVFERVIGSLGSRTMPLDEDDMPDQEPTDALGTALSMAQAVETTGHEIGSPE